jgi:hypothetical protein
MPRQQASQFRMSVTAPLPAVLSGGPSALSNRADGSELTFCVWSAGGLGRATLVAVTSAPPPECGRCQRAERGFRRGIPRSSFEELLAAVDVEGRAGDRGVRHEVDSQGGDVGWADDAADRQRGTELRSALVDPVAEQ